MPQLLRRPRAGASEGATTALTDRPPRRFGPKPNRRTELGLIIFGCLLSGRRLRARHGRHDRKDPRKPWGLSRDRARPRAPRACRDAMAGTRRERRLAASGRAAERTRLRDGRANRRALRQAPSGVDRCRCRLLCAHPHRRQALARPRPVPLPVASGRRGPAACAARAPHRRGHKRGAPVDPHRADKRAARRGREDLPLHLLRLLLRGEDARCSRSPRCGLAIAS